MSEIARVEEEANLILTASVIDNRTSDEAVKGVGTILGELKADGKIEDYDTPENADITNIKFDVSSITLGAGDNEELTATFESGSDAGGYYAQIKGKKYLVSKVNDKIEIGKTEITTSGNSKREISSVETSNSEVATAEIIEDERNKVKITGMSGGIDGIATATITINYTESISTTINVTVKAKYTVNLYSSSTATNSTTITVVRGEKASNATGYELPEAPEGQLFDKWLLKTSIGGNQGQRIGDEAATLLDNVTQNLEVYATFFIPPVKYAVQIYGINQDADSSNQTLGLTFGPATGGNYNNSYVTHEYEETEKGSGVYKVKIVTNSVDMNGDETQNETPVYLKDSSGNDVTRTTQEKEKYDVNLHAMSWAEIAAVSDKTKFTDCMLCGDTKSVVLTLNSTIKDNSNIQISMGEGAGVLRYSLKDSYGQWNAENFNDRKKYGYASSRIRATLIGKTAATESIGYKAGSDLLTSGNCLYSCIESDLKNVIVAKKVYYVTGSSESYVTKSDISDKIWLFSVKELISADWVFQDIAGEGVRGIKSENGTYNKFTDSCSNAKSVIAYNERGSADNYWERTPYMNYDSINTSQVGAQFVGNNGSFYSSSASRAEGIGFGFCIK